VRWPTRIVAGAESATELVSLVTPMTVLADAPAQVDSAAGVKPAVIATGDDDAENDARQLATAFAGVIGSPAQCGSATPPLENVIVPAGWPALAVTAAHSVTFSFVAAVGCDASSKTFVGPLTWCSVVCMGGAMRSDAVMVASPAVAELLIVAVYVPSTPGTVAPTVWPGSVEENWTRSSLIGWPCVSWTVAVAVVLDSPSAMIVLGLSESVMVTGGPAVCFSWAEPLPPEGSLALMVDGPTVVELVSVAVAVPSGPVTAVVGLIV
jgi:hypothetical protein